MARGHCSSGGGRSEVAHLSLPDIAPTGCAGRLRAGVRRQESSGDDAPARRLGALGRAIGQRAREHLAERGGVAGPPWLGLHEGAQLRVAHHRMPGAVDLEAAEGCVMTTAVSTQRSSEPASSGWTRTRKSFTAMASSVSWRVTFTRGNPRSRASGHAGRGSSPPTAATR